MTIEKHLRKLRLDRGMTQEQVAQRLGVTRQALSSYESGRTRPDIDTLMRLSEIYGTDLEGLVSGQDRLEQKRRRLKKAALLLLIALAVLTAASSAFLWSANRIYPIYAGNPVSISNLREIMDTRRRLTSVWEGLDGVILILGQAGLFSLFLLGETLFSMKQKGTYAGCVAAGVLLGSLPFGLTDQIFSPVDYLIVPGHTIVFSILLLGISSVLTLLRNRKN